MKIVHGMYKTPTYYSWIAMLGRCLYPCCDNYHLYGGRGIKICDRWKLFKNFISDMGERPSGTTLGRIDNNGNYEPSNCRWETSEQQVRNKRNNHVITIAGESKTLSEWSRELDIPLTTIVSRFARGQTDEQALKPGRNFIRKFITVNGITKSLPQWSKDSGIPLRTINARRIAYGWSDERAVTTPVIDAPTRCKMAGLASRNKKEKTNG